MKKYRKILGFSGVVAGLLMFFLFFLPFVGKWKAYNHLFDFYDGADVAVFCSFVSLIISVVLSMVQMKYYKIDWVTGITFLLSGFCAIFCTVSSNYNSGVGAILLFVFAFILGALNILPVLKNFFSHLDD